MGIAQLMALTQLDPPPDAGTIGRILGTELSFEVSQVRQKLSACESKSIEIRKEMLGMQKLDLQVGKIINTNVHLIIGMHEMVFRKPLRGPLKIFWNESQQIRYRQADGEEQRLEEVAEAIPLAA